VNALLAVELRRLLARRLVRVLVMIAVVGIFVAAVTVFFRSHRDSSPPALQAKIVHRNGQDLVRCSSSGFGMITGPLPEGMTPDEFCSSSGFIADDPRFHLTTLRDVWLGAATQLMIVAWLIGAAFLGAEWHSGTVTTQLTWEPRRTRVFLAKLLACMLVVFGGTILLELLLGAALYPAAALRGTTVGIDGAWVADAGRLLLRAGAGCSLVAGLGFGLAAIGRNTAASVGGGFFYLIVVESLVRGFKAVWAPWLLGDNLVNFFGGESNSILERSPAGSGLVVAAYTAIVLLVGLTLFRRRDVT
jgi:hypothetical protein